MSGSRINWLSVLRWWWARPKSIGMTVVILLVAGGLFLAESRGLVGQGLPQGPTADAGSQQPSNDSRVDEDSRLETIVASTQTGPAEASSSASSSPSAPRTGGSARDGSSASDPQPRSDPRRDPQAKSSSETRTGSRPAQEPLGKLTKVSGDTYRTTAGLVYTRGSADGHRLKHVARHFEDNRSKPVHGVFSGSERENFAAIDEAYLIATTEPRRANKETDRGRTIYKVDLRRKVGYVGGQSGQRKGNPACTGVQLVLEDERVITAYPIQMRRR